MDVAAYTNYIIVYFKYITHLEPYENALMYARFITLANSLSYNKFY